MVMYGNLATGGYVLKGTTPELSTLEENMGIRGTRVVNKGQRQVDAIAVIVFDLGRCHHCGISDKLTVMSVLRPLTRPWCSTHHAVELPCQIRCDGRSCHLLDRLSYGEGSFQRITIGLVLTPALVMIISMRLQLLKHSQVVPREVFSLDPKE